MRQIFVHGGATQFWKSNPMHWCDVCKCWMNDSKAARQNHERGMGHKANLERSESRKHVHGEHANHGCLRVHGACMCMLCAASVQDYTYLVHHCLAALITMGVPCWHSCSARG